MSTSGAATATPPTSRRWLLYCILFFLGWVMMYADRSILAPVQELIRQQFQLSNSQVGLISSVFFIVYVLVQIPSGILGDRMGRIRLITIGFGIFGVATSLTGVAGIAHIFGFFLLMRAAAGFGEGLYYGPQFAKSGEETPARYRALGAAIINSGQGVGIAIGIMASSFIAHDLQLGWAWSFIIFGFLTLLVGLAIWLFIPDSKPDREPGHLSHELSRFLGLLKSPTLIGAFTMLFCGVYTFFVMVTWLPTFLTAQWQMSPSEAAGTSALAFWVAVPAGLLVGHLSDRSRKRRLFVLILVPLTICAVLMMAWAPSPTVLTFAIVGYGLVGKLALDPVLISIIADNVSNDLRSSAYGLYNCVGMAAAILAPYATGALVDATSTFVAAFVLAAVVLGVGMTVFALTYRPHAARISS